EAEERAHNLVARGVVDPDERRIQLQRVVRLFILNAGGVRRIGGEGASREAVIASDVGEQFQACQRPFHVVEGIDGLRDVVAERFGRQVSARPQRRIATAGVAYDL